MYKQIRQSQSSETRPIAALGRLYTYQIKLDLRAIVNYCEYEIHIE